MSIASEITRLKNAKENIKTAIKNKGVDVSDSLTISDYAELIEDIPQGDEDFIKGLIECTSTEIIIPNYVTKVGDYAFYNFTRLTNISIPDNITAIGSDAFCKCTSLTNVTIPDSVTSIGYEAFRNCTALTDIRISANVTDVGASAYAVCPNLRNVTIPYGVKSISPSAFSQCNNLPNITIPGSVTSIGSYSFLNCSALVTINLPASITRVDVHSFDGCKKLTNVTVENGFNANNLNLSASTQYSTETIVSWLEALADRTGLSAYKLTIGATNLAKLTEEQIAIATAKNWTLA